MGKEGDRVETGLAHRVALELVDDQRLQQKGYVVVMDNYHSSPALFCDLMVRGFGACGTARKDRRGIPSTIRATTLRRGKIASSTDDGILSLKWKDKRVVTMLSTYHSTSMVKKSQRSRAAEGGVESIEKLQVVEDYNMSMSGVNKSKLYVQNVSLFFVHQPEPGYIVSISNMYMHTFVLIHVHLLEHSDDP